MTTLAIVVLGFGVGLGLVVTGHALRPSPPTIETVLNDLSRPGRSLDDAADTVDASSSRAGAAALRFVERSGVDTTRWNRDLLVLERSPSRQAADKLLGASSGFLVPNVVAFGLGETGAGLPAPLVILLSIGLAAGGFVLPDRLLRDQAEARRRGFRHALSSYLDLVNILLAGGAGIETALHAAADIGDGWGYHLIRSELRRARLTGRPPWDTLASLGERIGVSELSELAANVSLAGTQGARIRASLAAKADTIRVLQVAETETAAEAATERMTVPVAVLLLGFLLLISYPAVAQITSVGGPQP